MTIAEVFRQKGYGILIANGIMTGKKQINQLFRQETQ
jgi:hypothetical protein